MLDTIEYRRVRRQLNLIQEVWGRYDWRQIGVSLEQYGMRLRQEVASVFEEPAAAARMLLPQICSIDQGIEVVGLGAPIRIKLPGLEARARIREGVDGGADGEVMRAMMRLLDAGRPRLGTEASAERGHAGAAVLRYWEMTSGRALIEYQRERGDALPTSEGDWIMRQKVALHRAEQMVDIMEGHTSGYLNTQEKLAQARRTLGHPNLAKNDAGYCFVEEPARSLQHLRATPSRAQVRLDSSRWREGSNAPVDPRTRSI